MTVVSQAAARARAVVIRDATTDDSVTPTMVGGLIEDLVDSVPFAASQGDVSGPASSSVNNIPVFSDGTGKNIADSGQSVASILTIADAAADAGDAAVAATIPLAGGAPADVTKAAASAGAAGTWSRSDHKHNISTAVAGSFSVSGVAAAEGSASSLARSDHAHSLTGTLPVANGGTGLTSAGTSGNFLVSNGSAFVSTALPGPVVGTDLTDANVTKNISDGSQLRLPASTLAASTKTLTLGTSGSPEVDEVIEVIVYSQSQSYALANGGPLADTLYTVPAGTQRILHAKWNGSDWRPAGKIRLA